MKKSLLAIALGLVVVACGATKLATPSQADIERLSTIYPDYTLADLNEGKALYEDNCASCHKLYQPTDKSAEGWKEIVPEMVVKVNKSSKVLDAHKQDLILKYVTGMSSANPPM